jgi:alpha-beta hydrolase superfamily lysophospholipase
MHPLINLADSSILYRCWECKSPQAILLLVHGLGAQTERWDDLGSFFASRKITSYGIELQGFGATPPPRGHIDSFRIYDQDVQRLLAHIQQTHPGLPVFLVGESMGGIIAFNLMAGHSGLFNGMILICPVFKSLLRFSLGTYLTVFTSLLLNPQKTITLPFSSAMCTRDVACQKKLDTNPHELRVASAGLLVGILLEQLRAGRLVRGLRDPALFLHAGVDGFGDVRASRAIFNRIPGADKTLNFYPEMHHALHIDLGKEVVFQDMHTWIQKRM